MMSVAEITVRRPAQLSLGAFAPFWSKVAKAADDDCWEWLAGKDKDGYGKMKIDGADVRAHRFAWSIAHGEDPGDFCVCHSCDNPSCVNARHLFLSTHAGNVKDRVEKGRSARGASHGRSTRPERTSRGEAHGLTRLTNADVKRIKTLLRTNIRQRQIAAMFGITESVVSRIALGKTWAHV